MSYNPDEDLEFTNPELHMSVDVSFEQSVAIDSGPVELRTFIPSAYQRTPDRPNTSNTSGVATPKNKLNFENIHNTPVNHNIFFGKINDNMNIDPLLSNKIIKDNGENPSFFQHGAVNNQPSNLGAFFDVPFSQGMSISPISRSQTVDGAFHLSSNTCPRQPLDECTNQAFNQSIQLASNYKRKSNLHKNLFGKIGTRDIIHSELDGDVFHADSMPDFPTEPYVEQFRFKRIFSVPSAQANSQLSKPINCSDYKTPKAGQEFDNNLVGDWTRSYQLPVIPKMVDGVVRITPQTLSNVLECKARVTMENTFIIDCRYPYEYDGGHIQNAINIFTKESALDFFFNRSANLLFKNQSFNENIVVIFHCEYSQLRGPKLARFLRNTDRNIHSRCYPKLFYPEIYILSGGYREFYKFFPNHCTPIDYIEMSDARFSNQFAIHKKQTKRRAGENISDTVGIGKR